jgi:transketolase
MNVQADTVRKQFAATMLSVGKEDKSLVVIVGDISHGILQPFAQACPGRYFNIGILEPTMISMAAGMASLGLNVVAHTIAPFIIERSFEQLKLDFVYQNIPGNIVTVGSAFDYSNLGCTHHCYNDFALMKTLPGAEILCPSSPAEFDALFRQAYRNTHLTMYRVAGYEHGMSFDPSRIVLGKGIRVAEGRDMTLIAVGAQLRTALELKTLLGARGKEAEIIYIHSIRPLDKEMIVESIEKTRKIVVIEEHMTCGGLGDDILRITRGIDGMKFLSASIPDTFVHGYGTYFQLCEAVGLCADKILMRLDSAGFMT